MALATMAPLRLSAAFGVNQTSAASARVITTLFLALSQRATPATRWFRLARLAATADV